jgi:hypothetical protein
MTHQIRYRGELVGHFASEEEAKTHLKTVWGDRKDIKDFKISKKGTIELRCNGNLVDTFTTLEDAAARIDKLRKEIESNQPGIDMSSAFEVTNTTAPAMPPPETLDALPLA